jgi:ABC-type bacteriocin/lantibiotic exporter with double-glycine peptidase domain
MPSSSLNVPHFRQELASACVAACARMVLAHYGDVRSEADLRSLLDTRPTGTRAGNLMRLSGPAFEVYLCRSNLAEPQSVLAANQPAIVFLKTGELEYWAMDLFHTAVQIGVDSGTAALNAPYFATAPQSTSLPSFEKAWAATGQFAAFIQPRRNP